MSSTKPPEPPPPTSGWKGANPPSPPFAETFPASVRNIVVAVITTAPPPRPPEATKARGSVSESPPPDPKNTSGTSTSPYGWPPGGCGTAQPSLPAPPKPPPLPLLPVADVPAPGPVLADCPNPSAWIWPPMMSTRSAVKRIVEALTVPRIVKLVARSSISQNCDEHSRMAPDLISTEGCSYTWSSDTTT